MDTLLLLLALFGVLAAQMQPLQLQPVSSTLRSPFMAVCPRNYRWFPAYPERCFTVYFPPTFTTLSSSFSRRCHSATRRLDVNRTTPSSWGLLWLMGTTSVRSFPMKLSAVKDPNYYSEWFQFVIPPPPPNQRLNKPRKGRGEEIVQQTAIRFICAYGMHFSGGHNPTVPAIGGMLLGQWPQS